MSGVRGEIVDMTEVDNETIERFRAYLTLLAASQMDSFLGQRIDASDIVQQTLLDAVTKEDQFRGRSDAELAAWLRRILANNMVDAFRYHTRDKRNASREKSLDESIFQSFRRVDALIAPNPTPSQRACANEQVLQLPAALEQLSDAQREAIVLHHLQGLKLSETGKRMGKSEAAVCGLLHRGLKRLNEIMEE